MKRTACLAAVFALFACDIASAAISTRNPERTALVSARKRGYTPDQTACFVPLFASYARMDRNGRWVAGPRGRAGDAYRHEAWTRCGVIR